MALGRIHVSSLSPAHAMSGLAKVGTIFGPAFENKYDAEVVCRISLVIEEYFSIKSNL